VLERVLESNTAAAAPLRYAEETDMSLEFDPVKTQKVLAIKDLALLNPQNY